MYFKSINEKKKSIKGVEKNKIRINKWCLIIACVSRQMNSIQNISIQILLKQY